MSSLSASPPLSILVSAVSETALAEVFADGTDGAALGFVLAHLAAGARVLWIQDRPSRRECGRPHLPGIMGVLGGPLEILHLEVARADDVLWAMEQALGCPALGAVVGEVWGEPTALNFTATKRLALRVERGGVRAWLLRRGATPALSAARERWRVAPMPSPPAPDDLHAPGEPHWRATLFRSRRGLPGEWLARRDPVRGGVVLLRESDRQDALGTSSEQPSRRTA